MFAKQHRLLFTHRLTHPVIVHSPFFVVKISENSLQLSRYGFVAGKVIDKRAVHRNKVKRKLRTVLQELHSAIQSGHDFLFIIKKEAAAKTYQELQQEVLALLRKKQLIEPIA